MIAGIFILTSDSYACSNNVELQISTDKWQAAKNNNIIAKNCFSPSELPKILDEVQCLVKYDMIPTVRFTGYIKEINRNNDITLAIGSPFTTEGVQDLLVSIGNFSLYLLRDQSK